MPNEPQPKIFLSYAWANAAIADEIDNDFKAVGITFQRDVRDIPYTGSIKDFMNLVGKSDFVVMLISDEYIRSENCMYEVTELLGAREFEKRILPIIVNDAPVFKRDDHKKYYRHWQDELNKVNELLLDFTNEKTLEDKRKIQNINDYLGAFFLKITDLKSEKYETLKANNYRQMLDKIGFRKENVLEQILAVRTIEDNEEKELAFEQIVVKYPENHYVLFYKAHQAHEAKQYKKAKRYYEELLMIYPQDTNAHVNFAIILHKFLLLYHEAKIQYERALAINSQLVEAHNNLGVLLDDNLFLYEEAKNHYEAALRIDPHYATAHYNFARLLSDHFLMYKEAMKHYEQALAINPGYVNAHINLAILLERRFADYTNARIHYEKAIEINPDHEVAKKNLADLNKNHFS